MSFGQGGPRWDGGGPQNQNPQNQDPRSGSPQEPNPYGGQNPQDPSPYGGQNRQDPYGPAYGPTAPQPHQPPQQQWQQPWQPTESGAGAQPPFRGMRQPAVQQPERQGGTPDWAALAEASASRSRRKRWLLIGGGALATCVVAAIVATAVVSTSNGSDDRASDTNPTPGRSQAAPAPPGGSTTPEPSFSSVAPEPPPDPKDFVDSADKDKAPLSAATLFPGKKLTIGKRVYDKGATSASKNCAATTQGALGSSLTANGCSQVIRATYSRKGVAVTVGLAVFDKEAQALAVKRKNAQGSIASLSGAGVPTFCRNGSVCRRTTNSYGRYVYFTEDGFTDGHNVTTSDKTVYTSGDDIAQFIFSQLVARGQAEASAAAETPSSP